MIETYIKLLFAPDAEALLPRAAARAAVDAWHKAQGWQGPGPRRLAGKLRAVGLQDAEMRLPDGRHVLAWRGARLREERVHIVVPKLACPHCGGAIKAAATTTGLTLLQFDDTVAAAPTT